MSERAARITLVVLAFAGVAQRRRLPGSGRQAPDHVGAIVGRRHRGVVLPRRRPRRAPPTGQPTRAPDGGNVLRAPGPATPVQPRRAGVHDLLPARRARLCAVRPRRACLSQRPCNGSPGALVPQSLLCGRARLPIRDPLFTAATGSGTSTRRGARVSSSSPPTLMPSTRSRRSSRSRPHGVLAGVFLGPDRRKLVRATTRARASSRRSFWRPSSQRLGGAQQHPHVRGDLSRHHARPLLVADRGPDRLADGAARRSPSRTARTRACRRARRPPRADVARRAP